MPAIDSVMAPLARRQLAVLTGQAPDALPTVTPQLAALQPTAVPEVLGADLLGRRPDVVAARWRVEAATQGVNSARSEFYPNINIGAFIGLNSLGLDRLFNGSSRQMGVTPALRLPIFDGGRLRAQLGGRQAELDAATAQQLAIGTFVGASALAAASDDPPEVLRERVTSKGGTTYAALTDFQTWICSAAMLLGRLEMLSFLVLFTPGFWRK